MAAIECELLTKRFSGVAAVNAVTLEVPHGSIFALLGANGAGKTTTIKLLLNLLRPSEGRARVLGIDTRQLAAPDFTRIGYVGENPDLPGWMRVQEFLDYLRPFYPHWDANLAGRMLKDLDVPPARKIRNLSRGMRAKAALISSAAFRPELLLLDEPFSGLDPLVRDEVIDSVLALAAERGSTLLVSSHEVSEIETMIDRVGYLDRGRLLLDEPLEILRARFREVRLTLPTEAPPPARTPHSWYGLTASGRSVRFVETQFNPETAGPAIRAVFPAVSDIEFHPMGLRDIFVTLAKESRTSQRQEAA